MRRTHYIGPVMACLLVAVLERSALAIPAFARAYQVPCSTCHSAITRRNEFGDAFRKAGYRWPASAEIDREARQPLEMKGVSGMTSWFPAQLPIALSTGTSATWTSDSAAAESLELRTPRLRVLMGGAFGDHIGFFGKWDVGQPTPGELYVHLARLLNDGPELNVRVGLFEPTTTLFKPNEGLLAGYLINAALTGHTLSAARVGAEVNGIVAQRLFWAVGAAQNTTPGADANAYYHASYKLGGRSFLGERIEGTTAAAPRRSLTVGHWGYAGHVSNEMAVRTARIGRMGLDARLAYGDISLWSGVMYGRDRDLVQQVSTRNVTAFGEIALAVTPWVMPMYMYQYQHVTGIERAVQQHDVGVILVPIENMRVRVKATVLADERWNETLDLTLLFAF